METPDISVVIPVHREGRLVNHTLASVFRAVEYASFKDVFSEILVIMDCSDETTLRFIKRKKNIQTFEVSFGDPGLSRNFGVGKAAGRFIALIDGDDLFSKRWLWNAVTFLDSQQQEVVAHPEYMVVFGREHLVFQQLSSTDPKFQPVNLIENNYWTIVCAAPKAIFEKFPFQETSSTSGFGHEDWHFNCETLAAGVDHIAVPHSAAFIRRKNTGSILANANQTHRLIRPSCFFDLDAYGPLMGSKSSKAE